jgi:hypothetical protein
MVPPVITGILALDIDIAQPIFKLIPSDAVSVSTPGANAPAPPTVLPMPLVPLTLPVSSLNSTTGDMGSQASEGNGVTSTAEKVNKAKKGLRGIMRPNPQSTTAR